MLLLSLLTWALLPRAALLLRHCGAREVRATSSNRSALMQSLQCHNDYRSHVSCRWTEEPGRRRPLQLWIQNRSGSDPCPPKGAPVLHSDGRRTVQCRYETRTFSIGTTHTVFFTEETENCSSPPHQPGALSEHLRALPPAALATGATDAGDQWLQWSSPYPDSPALSRSMEYQVSYKSDGPDEWTMKQVTQSRVKLLKQSLRAGRTYTARVRGRTAASQWSEWSPAVSWRTPEDPSRPPGLHCVLSGEETVECRWSVSRDLDRIVGYRLAWHGRTSAVAGSCSDPPVVSEPSATDVTYSCSLSAPEPAHLRLELRPTHRSRSFRARQHIRPSPPRQLHVSANAEDWRVKWTEPITSDHRVFYQVCYFLTKTQDCSVHLNLSATHLNILDSSLDPSQKYTVLVRSVVEPGSGSRYQGTPSEWAGPVEWTSHAAGWSLRTLVYVCTGLLVASVFLALYFSVPACHRRAVLWVDSVPSPQKSRVLSEFRPGSGPHVMLSEKTSLCSVHRLADASPRSSLALSHHGEDGELDRGYWSSENSPLPDQPVLVPQLSVMGFSGPYIFCEGRFPSERTETSTSEGGAYVCLPAHPPTGSAHEQAYICNCPEATASAVPNEPSGSDPDVPGALTSWPAVRASGYCSLPAPEVP